MSWLAPRKRGEKVMLGGLALGGAYHSIKDAIFLTDKEIEDATKF